MLLRQRAAHAPARAWPRRASRCRSAPRSTATPASRPTSRSSGCCARRSSSRGVQRRAPRHRPRRRCSARSCTRRRSAPSSKAQLFEALQAKDAARAARAHRRRSTAKTREALLLLPELYGGAEVLDAGARSACRSSPSCAQALGHAARARQGAAAVPRQLRPRRAARLPLSQRRGVRRVLRRRDRRRVALRAAAATTRSARRSAARGRRPAFPSICAVSPAWRNGPTVRDAVDELRCERNRPARGAATAWTGWRK